MSTCFCNNTNPICRSHASVSRVHRPSFKGKANIGIEIDFSCKFWKAVSSSLFRCPRYFACDLRIVGVKGGARRAEFGTNLRNTLYKPINVRNSVRVVAVCKSRVASVVWLASLSRPREITWLSEWIFFVKNAHVFNLEVTTAFFWRLRTSRVWVMCSRIVCKTITVS